MSDDEKITQLPVKFKTPAAPERVLLMPYEVGKGYGCQHEAVIVDEKLEKVECKTCGEKLNPMWVLHNLASRDLRFAETHRRYHEEMERLNERSSTKCRHCGKMTRISRR